MKNTIKRTTALTAAIAAVATVGSKVNAEEVTTPVAPTTEPVAETTVATPTTTVSDEQVVTAKQTADNARVAVETKQAELDNTQAERDAKAEELATAKEQEKALADKVEAAKDVTPEKVTELEQTATEKTAEKDAKAQAVDTAKADQTVKQADADKKASALEQAKAEQKDAENKVKEAEDAISGTAVKDAQDAKDAADQKVNDAIVTKNTAAKELEDSKKADAERDAKKAQITSEIPAKEATATTAGEAVKSAEKALNAIPAVTNITINADWASDAKAYLDALNENWRSDLELGTPEYTKARDAHNAKVKATATALNKSADTAIQVASRKIDAMRQQGTSEVFDVANLPQDVLNDVNDQFITTVNEIRHALGLGDAKINTKNIEFAKEVAKRYMANDVHFINHSGKSIAEAAKALGYKYDANALTTETTSQPYENLATYWNSRFKVQNGKLQLSRLELMKHAAQSAISFMMEGAGGHFRTLASDSIQGVAFSHGTDERGNTILQLHVLNANSFGQKQITDEATTNRVLPETDRATAQAKLDQAKADKVAADKAVADAKAELARLNAEVSTTPAKQVALANANKAYTDAVNAQNEAGRRLNAAKSSAEDKVTALEQARTRKTFMDAVVAGRTTELETAVAALDAAKAETAKAEEALATAVKAEDDAKKALADAKDLLANKVQLENDLRDKSQVVVALTNALTVLENKLSDKANDVQTAKRALEDAEKEYKRLLAIYTAERKVAPLVQDENPEFEGGVNYAEDLVFELPELVIPEEPTTVPVIDAIIAQVTDNAPTYSEVIARGSETQSNVEVNKLPETGAESTTMQTILGTIFMLTGAGVASKRKKD
jgi:surface exclusion protein prgA